MLSDNNSINENKDNNEVNTKDNTEVNDNINEVNNEEIKSKPKRRYLPKSTKFDYFNFINTPEIQELLKDFPNSRHRRILKDLYEKKTGVKITDHVHYEALRMKKIEGIDDGGNKFSYIVS